MKKFNSILLAIAMSFYGFASVSPALALADDGGHHGREQESRSVSASNSSPTMTARSNAPSSNGHSNSDDNHGSVVSKVAHSTSSDGNHGSMVSTVAKTNSQSNSSDNNKGNRNENENENEHNNSVSTSTAASMPVISGIKAPTVLSTGQTGTWTIKAFDPQNGTLSYSIDWGDAPSTFARSLTVPVFVQTSTFTHTYSNPGTYTITFTVENATGGKTTSTITVHVIGEPVANLPVISNVSATSTSPNQASINWTTDINSSSLVWFGTTTPIDTSVAANISLGDSVTNHGVTLNNLMPDTKYYVVVGSANSAGVSTSSETWFMTPASPSNTPVITGLAGSTTVSVGEIETVTVSAMDPQNGSLEYSVDWGDNPSLMRALANSSEPFVQTATFTHSYATAGTYTAVFTVRNDAGLEASSSIVIEVTTPGGGGGSTAPVISNLMASSTGTTTEAIVWDTDTSTNSQVYYSAVTPVVIGGIGTALVTSDATSTHHVINLAGLTASSTYYFVTVSADSLGNTATSSELSFMTASSTPEMPTFTLANIALHNVQTDCWTALNGSVYDLTPFISQHPGGTGTIGLLCGINGTTLFNATHANDPVVTAALVPLKIGTLAI